MLNRDPDFLMFEAMDDTLLHVLWHLVKYLLNSKDILDNTLSVLFAAPSPSHRNSFAVLPQTIVSNCSLLLCASKKQLAQNRIGWSSPNPYSLCLPDLGKWNMSSDQRSGKQCLTVSCSILLTWDQKSLLKFLPHPPQPPRSLPLQSGPSQLCIWTLVSWCHLSYSFPSSIWV